MEMQFDTTLTTRYVRGIYENIDVAMDTLKKVHAQLMFYKKEDWVENIIEELARRSVGFNSNIERTFTISRMFVTEIGMCVSTSVSFPIKGGEKLEDLLDPLDVINSLVRDIIDPVFMAELGETNSYYYNWI